MQAGPHCVPRGGWGDREGGGHLHVYQSVRDSEFCVCACCMGGWSVCRWGCVCVSVSADWWGVPARRTE